MIPGMTTKIAVSLPDEQVAAARRAVREGRAASVSAYVSAALRAYQEGESLGVLLDDLDQQFGPVPEDVAAWAKQVTARMETVAADPRSRP
ncbi:hypothetical protein BH20ACT5_BH20ACT5_20380 [soil metagenome]